MNYNIFDEPDYGSDAEVASQSIDGLKNGETVFIFTKGQLDEIKKVSSSPFFYFTQRDGYVLFPSMCQVVDENNKVHFTHGYIKCVRFAKKYKGIYKLKVEVVEKEHKHYCFEEFKNYED